MSLNSTQYLLLVQLDFDLQYLCGQFQQFSMCLDLNHVPINNRNKTNCRLFLLSKTITLTYIFFILSLLEYIMRNKKPKLLFH